MTNRSLKSGLRSALAAFMCVVLLLAGIPVAVSAAETKNKTVAGDLLLATLSDLHYYSAALAPHPDDASYGAFISKLLSSNVNYETLDYIIDTAFDSLEATAITQGLKYVLLTGDLTLNGEKQGHEALAEKLHAFEEETGIQVLVANGNHDINNSKAASYSNEEVKITSPQDFLEIYYEFGYSDAYHTFIDYKSAEDKQAIPSQAGMLSYSQQLDGGYRLIVLDAGHYSADVTEDGTDEHETSGGVTPELLEWLLAEIEDAKANGEIPVMATHWNMSGASYLHEFVTVGFVIDEHYKLQEILADAGVHYVFSGHHHVSDIDITYSDKGEVMYSIITPTLTEFPSAYRVTAFSYDAAKDSITAEFNTYEVNGRPTVELKADYTGNMPYSVNVFRNQYFNGSATGYLMNMLRNFLLPFADDIVAGGGIIPYIETMLGMDLSQLISDLIKGGIVFADFELFTEKNIMSFLEDLDGQICKLLLADPEKTCNEVIEPAIEEMLNMQISEIPCTKFINTLGFGSTEHGGTLAEMFMSVMYYMYEGNEDISDDAFVQDALKNMQAGALVKPLLATIRENVINDVVLDTLLGNLEVNLTELFVDSEMNVIPEFDTFNSLYYIIVALVDSGCFDYLVGDAEPTFVNVMRSLFDAILNILKGEVDTSYLHLAEIVLDLANLEYGSSIDEVIDTLLEDYVYGDSMIEGIGGVMYQIVSECVIDDDADNNITHVYDGPIEITPTQDEMQIPSHISVTFGEDSTSSYNISWYTKYNVSGTDIELYKASSEPTFKGKNNVPAGIGAKCITTQEVRSFNGVDLGAIGLMKKERDVYRHIIQLTNLEPGATYYYRIGDAKLGYWSETGKLTTAAGEGTFTFFHFTDTQSILQEQYNVWATLLDDATAIYPNVDFIAHTGDFVDHGDGFLQWKWGLNAASDKLMSMALMPTAGNHEAYGTYAVDNYFSLSDGSIAIPQFKDTGIYYSYDYNNAHFIVLNTNSVTDDGELSAKQVEWLRKDVAESDADWLIVQMHESVYSQGAHYAEKDLAVLRAQILDLMFELDIDLVLSGHDHIYMRTAPLRNDGLSPATETVTITGKDGVTYTATLDTTGTVFVCGGSSGPKTYIPAAFGETGDVFPNEYYAYPNSDAQQITEPMFSAITINGTVLTLAAYTYDANGELYVCDQTALSKTRISFKSGDADADGKFEAEDARTALRLAVGLDWDDASVLTLLASDFNGDGQILADDARRILRCSTGLDDLQLVKEYSFFLGELK